VFGKGQDKHDAHTLISTFFKILAYRAEIVLHVTKQNPILENRQNKQL
jgi:hypothetical protein